MFCAFRKRLLLLTLLFSLTIQAQGDGCFGDSFVQLLQDELGRDVRTTTIIPYPGGTGDLLLGGTVGGNVFLSRISATGITRWRRVIQTESESTELSTLNAIIIDQAGMIAGVGASFNDNLQKAFLFRYDPMTDQLLYFLEPSYHSGATGIRETPEGNYLIAGNKQGEASPIFISAYLVTVEPTTGQPSGNGSRYDYLGDESFLDLEVLADGTIFAAGNISATGGSGDIRASISRFSSDGTPVWTLVGPIRPTANGRLLAFDVEVVGDKLYVLHWGNIGTITGGLNTTIMLSRIDALSGEVDWTQEYDLEEYDGESGIELAQHQDGLLIYGFSLIGKRDPWLLQIDLEGQSRWATSYELPGNATVYFRANQQLLVDPTGIVVLATFAHSGGRPREGMVLRVDLAGNSENQCLVQQDLTVSSATLSDGWTQIALTQNDLSQPWLSANSAREVARLSAIDDCDQACDDCFGTNFSQAAICRGDSLFLANAFRTEAGIYIDTLPGLSPECDSLVITELIIPSTPEASVSVFRQCGFATAEVRLTVSGGVPPYSFNWSAAGATNNPVFLSDGNYQVTVNDALGCSPVVLAVEVDLTATDVLDYAVFPPACPEEATGRIELTPAGRGSLRLLPEGGFIADKIDGLSAGEYFLILRDSSGCEAFRQVVIPEAEPVGISIVGPGFARLGDQISLIGQSTNSTNFSQYQWAGDASISCNDCPIARLAPTQDTWVSVEATTNSGCVVQDSFLIRVPENQARLYLPTAFSPNEDGFNDVWQPAFGSDILEINQCRIFNRWGGNVFDYQPDGEWWTGANQAPGTYLYQLTATQINGTVISRSGEIILLR